MTAGRFVLIGSSCLNAGSGAGPPMRLNAASTFRSGPSNEPHRGPAVRKSMAAFSDGKSGYFQSTFGSRFGARQPIATPV
jgi:hypothetical protein